MSTLRQIPDIGEGGNPEIAEALYGTAERIRKALKQDLKECGLSRDEVAVRLSVRVGRITVALLDAYIAESKASNRFPAEMIPAWVEVTKSTRLLEVLCGELGLSVATREQQQFAELGRLELRRKRLEQELWPKA